MGKVAGRTPTVLLLLPPDLVKDNLVIQCPHISINIYGQMGMASTRVAIATTSHPDIRTRTKRRSVWTGANMDTRNDGVGKYQRQQQIIIEIFY